MSLYHRCSRPTSQPRLPALLATNVLPCGSPAGLGGVTGIITSPSLLSGALRQVLVMMFPGSTCGIFESNAVRGDYYKREEPLFAVDLAMKDARHAPALANKAGVHMKKVEVVNEYLKVVKEHMGARGDIVGIYGRSRNEIQKLLL
jgi:hypothetical protein